jgi:hypothetical protein
MRIDVAPHGLYNIENGSADDFLLSDFVLE